MNNAPPWLPTVSGVVLTLLLGAFLLPIASQVYRGENWLFTWPLPEWERAERREAFEVQLAVDLARDRELGYQPMFSGVRLLWRMLSTLPLDSRDGARALELRMHVPLYASIFTLRGEWRHLRLWLWSLWYLRRLSRTDRVVREKLLEGSRDTGVRFNLAPATYDDGFRMRVAQSNQAMMDSANQVIRQNAALRERAFRIAIDSTGAQNPSFALLHGQMVIPPAGGLLEATTHARWDGPKIELAQTFIPPDTTA